MKKTVNIFLRILIFAFFTLFCFQYFLSRHYRYAAPKPFEGNYIFNPYSNPKSHWYKANFHAHSMAWAGVTNGHQTPAQIISHYKNDLHYDIACISNYEKIDPSQKNDSSYIPVYEHGYNLKKVHQLVLGDSRVLYYDVSLFQSLDNMQYIINCEKENSAVVAVNHPEMSQPYSHGELKKLSGYDMMEVLNNRNVTEERWDEALSAGKMCWIIADDDCHDISRPETGISWTMVNADENHSNEILQSLKTGKDYGVFGHHGINDHFLQQVKVNGDTAFFFMDSAASEIKLVGQDGVVKKKVYNTDGTSYIFQKDDHYIRAVISYPFTTIFLNPLVRYDGKNIPQNVNTATFNAQKTFFIRVTIWLIWMAGVMIIFRPQQVLSFLFPSKKTGSFA